MVSHHHEDDEFLLGTYGYARKAKDLIKGTAILWTSGQTFRNLCDIMVLYVTGLLPTSPSHRGPILHESNGISNLLAQCCRNGLLTVSSEPSQSDVEYHTGKSFTIENASVEFFVQEHNFPILMAALEEYGNRFRIQNLDETKLSDDFGPMYSVAAKYVRHLGIVDNKPNTNEIYSILMNISKEFTEFPIENK